MESAKRPRGESDPLPHVPVTELRGDLFDSSASLAHCVSECLTMGKGIAVEFKKRFGRVEELRAQGARVGSVAVLADGDRWVYFLVTKRRFSHKPTLESVRAALECCRDHAVAHDVTRIAMPRIGCGLDGLRWEHVHALLCEVFSVTSIAIEVYTL